MVQAAGGMVIPIAQATFDEVLKQDPKEFRARFYKALAREQAGDLTSALDQWTSLYADAPKDAGWLVDVTARIEDLGKRTGRDVSQVLASAAPAAPAEEAGAAIALDAKARQELINGMIAKLAAKLEANPQDRDGWAMMIRSLKVQGDMTGAQAALAKAMKAFENDPSARSQIAGLAQSLGVVPAGDASASAPQISQDQIAAVQALPASDQEAMISGMVDKLSARLAASPRDAEGWLRLIRSQMVLNQPDKAKDALTAALKEFATDAAVTGQITALATELGLTQNQTP
jgi:cytochrome c-type biogenesis protein CcmH